MPTVTIDGKTITVPANTMVVEAAKPLGIHIPVFCYHPKLEPVGMCRMCLVEVGTPRRGKDGQIEKDGQGNAVIAWMPKLQTACTTAVSDGMVVRTDSAAVTEARRAVIEFLLTSHPLDCPICDKGGECPLQDHTLAHGPGVSRFRVESKFHNEKHVPLGPLVVLDRERCIQCSRCVRFQTEVAGDPVLGFAARGRGLEIVTLDDPPFDSQFSGNTIDICPVGALTNADFRFTARVFELNDHPSVCAHCSVGCNLLIGERDHEIKRITPRENEAVNEIWLCDKGRFVHHFATANDRLVQPLVRRGGELVPTSWYDALSLIGARLNQIRADFGGDSFAGIAGDRAANEDLYLFQKLFRQVAGSGNLDHRIGWSQWNAGVELVQEYGAGLGTDLGQLGKNTTVLMLGADPEAEQPVIRLRLSASARRGAALIVANGRQTRLAESARHSVLYRYGAEAEFLRGLLRILSDENLWNNDFVANRIEGADAFKEALASRTANDHAEGAGIPLEKLQAVARALVATENLIVLFGREFMFALAQEPALESLLAGLVALTGRLGRKDNGLIALYPHNNSTGALDMGILQDYAPGRMKLPKEQWGDAKHDLLNGKPRFLYVMAADPARDHAGFRKPDFLVVQDLFLTETARRADVVLPAQSWAERDGTFTNTERRVQLFRRAIRPRGEARPDWEIIQEIANAMGAEWHYESSGEIMREIAERVPLYSGMDYERLAVTARRRASVQTVGSESVEPVQIALGELFGDVSGRQWMTTAEADPQAKLHLTWQEPKPVGPEDDAGLWLATSRSLYDAGTLVQRTARVQGRVPHPRAELNSHDAEDLGVENGNRVRLTWEVAPPRSLVLDADVNGSVPPGVIRIPANLKGTYGLIPGPSVRVEKVLELEVVAS